MATWCVQHPGRPVRQSRYADNCQEDSRHGLSPMPGRGEPVKSSVREEGHGGRAYVQGTVKEIVEMRQIQRVVGGPKAGPEWMAPGHGTVCKGGGAEETTACGGRDEGDLGAGLQGIRENFKNVSAFQYLGRVLTSGDNYCLAVVGNIGKARKSWGRFFRVLGREGAGLKVSGDFIRQ